MIGFRPGGGAPRIPSSSDDGIRLGFSSGGGWDIGSGLTAVVGVIAVVD